MAAPAAAPAAAAAAAAAAPVTIDWQAPEPRGLKRFPLTDCGNAERLVHRHGAAMRFVHEWKEWIVWQKAGYWRLDNYEVKRRAKETVRTIAVDAAKLRKEAAATSDEAEKAKKEAAAKALTRHATECEAKSRLAAMCDLAQSEYGVTIEAASLDRHRFKLNFANGTLSLKTFELRPHNPHDLITKMVCRRDPDDPTKIEPIKYDPNAKAPTWEAFLHRIFDGNARLISYVQRAAGYSMTGSSREKCLFLLWGQVGNNGKTTFLEVLRAVLADYAGQVKIETLMDSDRPTSGDAPSADMADLKGTRFVTASEPKKNQKFHEGKLKYLTGMGEIKARRPHDRHTVSFQQTWKFWIECNNRPVIIGSDDALWSRFHLIPFTVHIPAAERDADLREKLMAELEGIIAWCVEGARAWQEHGLQPPPEVTAATEEYRAEMDIPGRFFDECTAAAPGMHIRARALYHAFKTWCAEVNEYPCKEREFGQRCTARGLERVHRNIGEVYLNIRMIRTFDPPSTTETDTVSENTKGEGMRDSEGTSHKLSHAPARPKFSNFTEKGSPSLTPHLSLDGSQTDTEEL